MSDSLIESRYEALEKLGGSPLFEVFKAQDKQTNRLIAFKRVTSTLAADANFLEGLRAGLTSASRLNHSNLALILSMWKPGDPPYFTSELVRGSNLKERLRKIKAFPSAAAIDISCAITEALHHAHSMGIVHGDLRPQNVLLTPEGAVKITDFGVAEGIARSSEAQKSLLTIRAPYLAPELNAASAGTAAGDIYAMGALLYEMLTATPAFFADDPKAIADLHAFAAIPSPRSLNSSVSRPVESIILKSMSKLPEQRYNTSAELLSDLKSVRDNLRFGKPLTWNPADIEKQPVQTAQIRQPINRSNAETAPYSSPDSARSSAPTTPMPSSSNRLRARQERVSFFIQGAIGVTTALVVVLLGAFYIIYKTFWSVAPPEQLPNLVGMDVNQAQQTAQKLRIHLLLHGDYMNRPRNIIYKTDLDSNGIVHQNHYVNVWYSKGPVYVDVPDVTGLDKTEARRKLRDSGLTVGKITPVYSNTVPLDVVVSQDVSTQKRVLHDTAVDLMVSDGPQPDYAQPSPSSNAPGDNSQPADNSGAQLGAAAPNSSASPQNSNPTPAAPNLNSIHEFDRTITLNPTADSGPGPWMVRISFTDASGQETDVINEEHNAGDKVHLSFPYQGSRITLKIYYNETRVFRLTFNPNSQKYQGAVQGNGQ